MTQAPVAIGGRVILPIIRDGTACWPDGAGATRDPVALLIADGGEYFFAPLETGITPDVLNDLTHNKRTLS
jgi:hypothetical protein